MNAKKKLVEYLLMIALYLFICIVLYASAASAQPFPYTKATVREIDVNYFEANITTTVSYTPQQIEDFINASVEKSPNIDLKGVVKIPSGYLVYGSLRDYSIPYNKLFNPWFNGSWLTAKKYAFSYPGIYRINMTNATGNDNATYIFLGGKAALVNITDLRVTLNDSISQPFYFDNDTSQSSGNMELWWNQTQKGNISIYYNNSGATVSTDYNLTKVMNYADGWNGYWNYTYTQGTGGQVWATQPNGTMMQTDAVNSVLRNLGLTQTTFPASYQVVTIMKFMTTPTTGRGGVQVGADATHDIGAGICSVVATQNCAVQDNLAFGTAGTNSKTLVANEWFKVEGITTGAAQRSRITNVNQPEQAWQGSGTFTSSTTKRIGMYGTAVSASAYRYWYAFNGTVLNAGSPLGTFNFSPMSVISYSNNLTNDNSLSLAAFVPKIIMFNASLTNTCDNCTWSVNGVRVTNMTIANQTSTNYSFTSTGVYLVNLTAFNISYNSTATLSWTVTMSILTIANLDGFVNNTPLGAYVDAVRVDLLNTTGTGSNFTTFTHTQYLPNATNLAPTIDPDTPGTGERVDNVTYYSNETDIEVISYAHAMSVSDTARVFFYLNDALVCTESGRPLGAAEEAFRACTVIVPQGAFYRIDFTNFHHYAITEQRLIRGYYNFSSVPTGNYSLLFRQIAYDNLTHTIILTANTRYNATIIPSIDDDTEPMSMALLGFIIGLIALALIIKHRKLLRHDGVH